MEFAVEAKALLEASLGGVLADEARPYFRKLAAAIFIIAVVQVPFVVWIAASASDWWSLATWIVGIAPGAMIFLWIASKGHLPGQAEPKDTK